MMLVTFQFLKTLKFSKFVADDSIAQEIQDSNNFQAFFNPEFNNCMINFLNKV